MEEKEKITKEESVEEVNETIGNDEEKKEHINKYNDITRNSKRLLICTILAICLIIVTFFLTGFALLNMNNDMILKNIIVQGIEVQNLNKEKAIKKLEQDFNSRLNKEIILKLGEDEYLFTPSQIELNYLIEDAVEKAYNIGRSGNIIQNNFEIINCYIKGKQIDIEIEYNEELLDKFINELAAKIPNSVTEPTYCIEDEQLIITKGKEGYSIDFEKTKQTILEAIKSNIQNEIIIEEIFKEPNDIDIEKIYKEVYTEPKDAYYIEEPFELFTHVNGINFDLENAKQMLLEEKDEYVIDLIITEPEILVTDLGADAFPDLLSAFTTKYDASNTARTTNLKLAAQKLNEVIIMPGEICSYNEVVGKRTVEAGYKDAAGYAGDKVVPMIGGGICQISSTLYDAVLYANLEIVERHNHSFLTSYIGAGKDATVVYGSLDFKFRNNRNYPIMLKTSVSNGIAKIEIYGIKEEKEYEVEITTKILNYIPYSSIYTDSSSLEEGKEKVTQGGMNGCNSITYKILKLDGQEISKEILSTDTYSAMNRYVIRGTKKIENNDTNETVTTSENIQNENIQEENLNEETSQSETQTSDLSQEESQID